MDYRKAGKHSARVTSPCPGAMMFGQVGNNDHHDSVRFNLRAAAGMNFIDTAGQDHIGPWLSADEADA